MTVLNNADYYRDRRDREIALAENARDPAIRQIHSEMAERYAMLEQQAMANRGLNNV